MPKVQMTESEITTKVKTLIRGKLGSEESAMTMDADFKDDLGADSLDHVELIMMVENDFDIKIYDEDAEKIQTIGDLITYIVKYEEK